MRNVIFSSIILVVLLQTSLLYGSFKQSNIPTFCSDIQNYIIWNVLSDPSVYLEDEVPRLSLVSTTFRRIVYDILCRYRGIFLDDYRSKKITQRHLLFCLSKGIQKSLNTLTVQNDFQRDINYFEFKDFCMNQIELPFVYTPWIEEGVAEEDYTDFLDDCCEYIFIKTFSSFMTYYGYTYQKMQQQFPDLILYLQNHESFSFDIGLLAAHVGYDCTYFPLIHPSLNNYSENATEVIIKITQLNDTLPEECEGCLYDYFYNQWEIFWQKIGVELQIHVTNEITLSFWELKIDPIQLKLCIKAMPKEIKQKVVRLDLTGCGLEDIPKAVSNLYNLEWLDCWNNNLTDIPGCVYNCKQLQHLVLSENRIQKLSTKNFPILSNLVTLSCSGAETQEALISFEKVPRLNSLVLCNNPLHSVAFKLEKDAENNKVNNYLSRLDLSKTKLVSASKVIGKMKSLEYLNLKDTELNTYVRTDILKLPGLKTFKMPSAFLIPQKQILLYKSLVENGVIKNTPCWFEHAMSSDSLSEEEDLSRYI